MSGIKIFLDSNIVLYLLDNDSDKKRKVLELIHPDYYISTQVVAENINVCLKKLKTSKEFAFKHGHGLMNTFKVLNIENSTISQACDISLLYKLNFWDSLIVSTALTHGCSILYTEDLQHELIIEQKLKVINPFKA